MGNGPKDSRETAKAPAGAVLDVGGGEAAPTDFCLRTHTLGVRLRAGAELEIGVAVSIGLGSPPWVVADGEEVGELDDPLAGGLTHCLVEGFRFSGFVDQVDLEGRRARVTVKGAERA
ncbi:MAG TPA: hypothetical protein VMT37_16235 [Solirubrobacterales bacterium]|nr:hypothetical protein [Solirubrobacterales bacterium]